MLIWMWIWMLIWMCRKINISLIFHYPQGNEIFKLVKNKLGHIWVKHVGTTCSPVISFDDV